MYSVCMCLCACMHVSMCVYACICVCVCLYMCVCAMYVHVCVHSTWLNAMATTNHIFKMTVATIQGMLLNIQGWHLLQCNNYHRDY